MVRCVPLLISLGVVLTVVGAVCLALTVLVMLVSPKFSISTKSGSGEFVDPCSPKEYGVDEKFQTNWYVLVCLAVDAETTKTITSYQFDDACTCKRARMAAGVMMVFVSVTQFVVGVVFSTIGCFCTESTNVCRPRRAWRVLIGIVALYSVLTIISFILAVVFRMYQGTEYESNSFGAAFTAFCLIDFFLNLGAVIVSCVGIGRGIGDNNQPESMQGQGQGSQSLSTRPPAYSKSQTNTSTKSKPSSQNMNKRQ